MVYYLFVYWCSSHESTEIASPNTLSTFFHFFDSFIMHYRCYFSTFWRATYTEWQFSSSIFQTHHTNWFIHIELTTSKTIQFLTEWGYSNTYIFSTRQTTAFLCSGTLANIWALCIGVILNNEVSATTKTNKHKNVKYRAPKRPEKDIFCHIRVEEESSNLYLSL